MKYGLVIDLGATNLRVALVNDKHEIVEKSKVSVSDSKNLAKTIYYEYQKFKNQVEIEKVVVGIAGSIDFKNNTIRDLPNLKLKDYNLKETLFNLFNVEIVIVNDASLSAIGESSKHKGERVFQYITISSGIGGALIIDKKLFEGNNGFEQEIGRMIVNNDEFEQLCSGNALKNRLLKAGIDEEYPSSALISQNDKYKKVVEEWENDLAIGVSNIIKIVNPSMIVFGGGLGVYVKYFKKDLCTKMLNYLPNDIVNDLKIEESYYKDDSGLVGGSYLIFQDN